MHFHTLTPSNKHEHNKPENIYMTRHHTNIQKNKFSKAKHAAKDITTTREKEHTTARHSIMSNPSKKHHKQHAKCHKQHKTATEEQYITSKQHVSQ